MRNAQYKPSAFPSGFRRNSYHVTIDLCMSFITFHMYSCEKCFNDTYHLLKTSDRVGVLTYALATTKVVEFHISVGCFEVLPGISSFQAVRKLVFRSSMAASAFGGAWPRRGEGLSVI